jgi:type IV pilus assembly protein PilF
MKTLRVLLVASLVSVAGCVSTTAVETKTSNEGTLADARKRAEVHTVLAGEYYSRASYGVALQETRLAIRDDASYAPAWNMQGLVYMQLRDDPLARESFERALRLEPNNSEVLNNYGWFQCLRGDPTRGLELLNRAAVDPLYPTPEKVFLSLGLCLRKVGRLPEAETYLRRAVGIRPDMIGGLYNLAEVTYERGNFKDAEAYLHRYLKLSNPTLDALILGVKVARANGDRGAEESYLQQMRRRFPDSPQTREAIEGRKP